MVLACDIPVQASAGSVKNADEFFAMPSEFQELAKHLMLVHTEGEISCADDYIRIFYPLAPNAYEKLVCCERAAEEVTHFRLGAEILADVDIDVSYMVSQDLYERPLYPNDLVRDVQTWMERGVFSFLGEAVILDHLMEFGQSSYLPFAQIFKESIIADEHTHVAHGYRIVKAACASDPGRQEAQQALDRFWPIVLDLFGSSESRRSPEYVRWGLRITTNAELRDRFMKKTRPRLAALGLKAPDDIVGRKFF